MKLIYCPECGDIFSLREDVRFCYCKKSYGNYLDDGLNAVIGGEAIPIGFNNFSFTGALNNIPESGKGITFEAFFIPKKCDHIKRIT